MLTIVTRFGWRKALRRSKICTNRFILGCYLLVVQLPPLLLEGWRKLCHSFVDTNGQKRNFFLQKLVCAGLCAFLSYPLVSFRCFTYSFLLIWYLPICLLTCESYLLYSIFPLCLIWRVMPGPSRLCLWSHVIRFASYSLNSLLHLPKKNNEKKKLPFPSWNNMFGDLESVVESRFFESPRETNIGWKNRAKCSFLFHIIKN